MHKLESDNDDISPEFSSVGFSANDSVIEPLTADLEII